MSDFKKAVTKVVVSELNSKKSKRSTGVKIATVQKNITIITVAPFSK